MPGLVQASGYTFLGLDQTEQKHECQSRDWSENIIIYYSHSPHLRSPVAEAGARGEVAPASASLWPQLASPGHGSLESFNWKEYLCVVIKLCQEEFLFQLL